MRQSATKAHTFQKRQIARLRLQQKSLAMTDVGMSEIIVLCCRITLTTSRHIILVVCYHQWRCIFDIFLQLYNVVVDTQDTSKKLLQKGQLKRRYTIIPLNKIAGKKINPDTIKKAKSLVNINYYIVDQLRL